MRALIAVLAFACLAPAQTNCVPESGQEIVIYRAGSLTRAFQPLEKAFTCKTGVMVKDFPMGSVDAGRQITAGGHKADLYAPADYLDIDLFMKPAGYSDFNIVFAHGRMVLAYSQANLTAKKLPAIAESPGKAVANWYEILARPDVTIGGGNFFLDPGAYRTPMIFQLAEAFYKVPNLYNNLLERLVIPSQGSDFQFTYEHNARATAATNPDYRYVDVPDEINMSDASKDAWYRQNAVVVLPGLGTPRSARTIAVPAARVAWGITLMKDAPNRENAVRFLELLLGPEGTAALKENGPDPITPPIVSAADMKNLPEPLRKMVAVR